MLTEEFGIAGGVMKSLNTKEISKDTKVRVYEELAFMLQRTTTQLGNLDVKIRYEKEAQFV